MIFNMQQGSFKTFQRRTYLPVDKLSISQTLSISFGLSILIFAVMLNPSIAQTESRPTLPATNFPSDAGIKRTSHSMLLGNRQTILGQTELVAFWSSAGLCVELDHPPHQSRAGGCAYTWLPPRRAVAIVGVGFSRTLGASGVTEIIGQASPSVARVIVEYEWAGETRPVRAKHGRLPIEARKNRGPSHVGWFGADIPGCSTRGNLRVVAYDFNNAPLGMAHGLSQDAACKSGIGYKARGALTFGSLP